MSIIIIMDISKLTEESRGNLKDIADNFSFTLNSDNLKSLFDNLKSSYDAYDNINIINTRRFDPKSTDSKKLLRGIFTVDGLNNEDSTVYREYHKFNRYYEKRLRYDDTNFHLKFYFKDTSQLINPVIKRFDCIMRLYEKSKRFKHISDCLNDKPFDIYFLLYPVNRETPTNRSDKPHADLQRLKNNGTYNCSSGYTTFFGSRKHMLITRNPECLGLLVHELGHLLGWDLTEEVRGKDMCTLSGMISDHKFTKEQKDYLNRLPLENKTIVPTEAFCNTYSTIIHSICNVLEFGGNFNDYVELLKKEIMYSIYHSAKILHYLGYDSYEDFFMNPDNKLRYFQSAYLFEYTILRSFMLINLDKIFKIGYEPKNINKILNISLKSMITHNKEYEEAFNNFIQIIKNKGKLNMEYFAFDREIYGQLGGGYVDYYEQYEKYLRRYLKLI